MNKRIRFSLAALATAFVAVTAAGCGSTPAGQAASDVVAVRGVAAAEPGANPRPLGAADTAFGLDVMRTWCAQYPRQNLVFSPSTLASALGLAYLGARGATAKAMARVLDLPAPGPGTGTLTAQLQARSRALDALDGPGVTLAAVNQVWADPGLPPLTGYLNAVATSYNAGVERAPFSADPAKAADQINQAISAATRGHISKLVTPDMLVNIGWVLTSALYMNARWATPFDPQETSPGQFTQAGAQPVSVPFMHGSGFPTATTDGWTAVSLPYRGGQLSMTALLPPAQAGSCALPTVTALAAMTARLAARDPGGRAGPAGLAGISLPKVSLAIGGDMGDMRPELNQLGMGLAFGAAANFTGLSPAACCIGFVQQAATLQVGEKGTVGAAAAAVGIAVASGTMPLPTVTFNRPYLMLVTATATGEPLFLAKVANPAAMG